MIRALCFSLFPAAVVPLSAQAQPVAAGEQTILVTGHGGDTNQVRQMLRDMAVNHKFVLGSEISPKEVSLSLSDYLHELGSTHAEKWQQYLERLAKLGLAYPTVVPPRPAGVSSWTVSRMWPAPAMASRAFVTRLTIARSSCSATRTGKASSTAT